MTKMTSTRPPSSSALTRRCPACDELITYKDARCFHHAVTAGRSCQFCVKGTLRTSKRVGDVVAFDRFAWDERLGLVVGKDHYHLCVVVLTHSNASVVGETVFLDDDEVTLFDRRSRT